MSTRRACVMGWPVKHSRAPIIHGYWIDKHGLDAELRLEEVRPEDFGDSLAHLGERGYVGGSATMPHKEMALKLTEPDARATAIGAANVIWLDNRTLRSTNSDVAGFVAALDETAPGWDKGADKAVVFGAGGAARAVIYGLLERGVERIHVHNRPITNYPPRSRARRSSSTRHRSACTAIRTSTSTSRACARMRWSPMSCTYRSKRAC